MSNFKMPKGEFVGQFAQAPWISLHRHNLIFGYRHSESFYPGVSISGFLHGKKKLQHHEVLNAEMPKCETPKYRTVDLTPFRSSGYRELEC
jgi:hypothetical protein